MELNEIMQYFRNVKQINEQQFAADCPACGDSGRHLYITARDGKILADCKKGCRFNEIVQASGLKAADFFPPKRERTPWIRLREHIYTDSIGNKLAKKIIYDKGGGDKTAVWERYENGTYTKGLNGMKLPPYHVHNLTEGKSVIIAEGEKDVETLERMGYRATTSPNGAGGRTSWIKAHNAYFKGKSVCILTDNDEAGRIHGRSTAESLHKTAREIRLIPSEAIYSELKEKGDISDIVEAVGLDEAKRLLNEAMKASQLYVYNAEEAHELRTGRMTERFNSIVAEEQTDKLPSYIYYDENKEKFAVSCPLLAEHIRQNCRYFFVYENTGNRNILKYWYSGGVYRLMSDNEIKGMVKRLITCYDITLLQMKLVEEVFKDICTDFRFVEYEQLNADENIINFHNGILCLDTMKLVSHSPDILSTIQIPCDWNPHANAQPVFDKYMSTLTDGNREIQQLLLEFMGVALSNVHGYRMKKSLFIVGAGDSGKSQLRLLCDKLLGSRNVSSESIDTFETTFGAMALSGKRLIGSPDMPYMPSTTVNMFKMLTGGDSIPMQVKNGGFYTIRFNGLVWQCGNELPRFSGDRGKHVYNRFVIVHCDNSIPIEKQDAQLLGKMYEERESIVVSAVRALKRVLGNGYRYDIPERCNEYNREFQKENSPVQSFYYECCCERRRDNISDSCTCSKVYEVFKEWCRSNNYQSFSARSFRKELAGFLSDGDIEKLEKTVHGYRYYNFTLTTEAKRDFISVYGVDGIQ